MDLNKEITFILKNHIPNPIRRNIRLGRWYLKYIFTNSDADHLFCPVLNLPLKAFVKNGNQLLTYKNEALSRHRMIMNYLREQDILERKISLLHVAPEPCLQEVFLNNENINYVGIDKFEKGYSYPNFVVNGDITQMTFKNNSFDLIICNHVLEHIHEDAMAMAELYRVLKDDGVCIITVPIDENIECTQYDSNIVDANLRKKLYGQWDHVRMYGLDIKDKLSQVGFEVEAIKYKTLLGKQKAKQFGIQEDYLFLVKKPT